jgi:uncharacterized membrane protein
MNLQVSPDAPLVVHAAAAAVLALHIAGGTAGIVAGATAMVARKGGRLHRASGTVFFVAMLTMATIAAAVSPLLREPLEERWTNTTAGVFTLYLVATAWATVRRRPGEIGRFEVAAALVPLGIAAMGLLLALVGPPTGKGDGFATVYAFAVIASLAALGDMRMIRRGGISGAARVTRHLWRMGLALFVATGSLFLGQQQVFPEPLRGSPILMAAALAPLAAMVFWLLRVRLARGPRLAASPAT